MRAVRLRSKSGRAPFIVFEGIDGSGKSTLLVSIAERLAAESVPVSVTREPTGGRVGRLLHSYLTREYEADPGVAAALFAADRIEHITGEGGMLSMLGGGTTVLCDRYFLSSCAYQSKTLPMDYIIGLNSYPASLLMPDLTVFVDTPPEVAFGRIGARLLETGEARERFEESAGELERVRDAYFEAAERMVPASRFFVLDGSLTPDELADRVMARITADFKVTEE